MLKREVSSMEMLRRNLEKQTEDIVIRYLEKSSASLKNEIYNRLIQFLENAKRSRGISTLNFH